jgi:ankyrin repeat protein
LIIRNNVVELEKILVKHPECLSDKSLHQGTTLLHLVCGVFAHDKIRNDKVHNIKLFELFLNHGDVSLLGVQDRLGQTPLHVSCLMNDIDSMRLLLKHGADQFINVLDIDRKSVLDIAIARNNFEAIELLTAYGAVRAAQEQELPFMPPLLVRQNAIVREDFGGGGGGGAAGDPGYLYVGPPSVVEKDFVNKKASNQRQKQEINDTGVADEKSKFLINAAKPYTFTLHFNNGTQHEIVFPRGVDYQRFMEAVEDYVELKEIESIYLTDEDGIDLDGRVLSYRLDFDLAQKSEFIQAITQGKVAENQHLVVTMHQDRQA